MARYVERARNVITPTRKQRRNSILPSLCLTGSARLPGPWLSSTPAQRSAKSHCQRGVPGYGGTWIDWCGQPMILEVGVSPDSAPSTRSVWSRHRGMVCVRQMRTRLRAKPRIDAGRGGRDRSLCEASPLRPAQQHLVPVPVSLRAALGDANVRCWWLPSSEQPVRAARMSVASNDAAQEQSTFLHMAPNGGSVPDARA
jgi:hypothetical protein